MHPILIVFIAYLIGNFSPSFVMGKLTANIDIRQHGSGNAGTTNVMRTLGMKAAVVTLLLDCLKGVFAVYLARRYGTETIALVAGIAVVIGHNWPALLKFKGGKGVATTIGVGLIIHTTVALACIIIGLIILYKYKYMSLTSITGMVLLPIFMTFVGVEYFIFGLILCLLALYRHKENIKRLRNGTERKITDKSKVK
ncbi:MAG: glycerol-3-phosphate 1-O-acyltransferase PlsY [Clostridiaceae bacterium]|nr:glycerol-3-phosphate 1-O-acyltransferase PlsY [Clostridiaceae bacterium]